MNFIIFGAKDVKEMSSDFSFGSSKSFDSNLFELLDQISPYVDKNNSDEVDLFSQIHLSNATDNSQQKLISLLLLILQNREKQNKKPFESKIENILISLLSECFSIFHVLSSGNTQADLLNLDISKIQCEALKQQSKKIEDYLSTFSVDIEENQPEITKIQSFLKQTDNLPLKINEINEIKLHEEKESNPKNLHFYFNALYMILESTLIMNDFLLSKEKDIKKQKNIEKVQISDHESIQQKKAESLRERQFILQLEELLDEKEKLATNLNTLQVELSHQNQVHELISKLKQKIKNIEEENFQMRKSLDEMIQQNSSIYHQLNDNSNNLSDQIATHKKENTFLREQNDNLQDQIHKYQEIAAKKNVKIEHLTDEIKSLNQQNLDISKNQEKLQNMIKDLQSLYQESISQIENYKKHKTESINLLNKARKEINTLVVENDELKVMLQRAARESQKQILDNATLLKQLRRQNNLNENENENEKLREKLQMAQFFIKKLQEEISKYRDQLQSTISSIRTIKNDDFDDDPINQSDDSFDIKINKKKFKRKPERFFSSDDLEDDFNRPNDEYDNNDRDFRFDPKLNDFDRLIGQLEETVTQTRNESINYFLPS